MPRLLSIILVSATFLVVSASQCEAESWIFRRSYYSHQPAQTVQIEKTVSQLSPYRTRPQGAFVRGGYRIKNDYIRVGGRTMDQTIRWESWYQAGRSY